MHDALTPGTGEKAPDAPQRPQTTRAGDAAALARVVGRVESSVTSDAVARKRKMVAGFCRMVGESLGMSPAAPAPPALVPPTGDRLTDAGAAVPDIGAGLAPRVRQTLGRLLAGDSEKQIALHLKLSKHTVHVYVKAVYRHFGVSSRGELLARFVRQDGAAPGRSARRGDASEPT